jgi:putative addiction module component (TIGR02574 family)
MAMGPLSNTGKLSVAERILYVEDIWDSIAADQPALEVTNAQREELDRRLAAHEKTRDAVSTWEDVKSALQSKE